ncbi:MAG: glucose 1-dehydrogenase, partial [Bacillota bacterium]
RLEGKSAIVTGAASGMGREIAKTFAREGAKVVVSDIDREGCEEVVAAVEEEGGTAKVVVADVSVQEDVDELIRSAVDEYGTLDILVNNAGIMDNFVPAHELTDDLWNKVFAVNLDGPMMLTRGALPLFMEKESGVIINISSLGGLRGSRAGAAYTASKHALVGFTRNVGFQYADLGIRCNTIAPGAVVTGIGDTIDDPSEFGSARAQAGMGLVPRYGDPAEIASIALFLASGESSFINGEVIVADAGWAAY